MTQATDQEFFHRRQMPRQTAARYRARREASWEVIRQRAEATREATRPPEATLPRSTRSTRSRAIGWVGYAIGWSVAELLKTTLALVLAAFVCIPVLILPLGSPIQVLVLLALFYRARRALDRRAALWTRVVARRVRASQQEG